MTHVVQKKLHIDSFYFQRKENVFSGCQSDIFVWRSPPFLPFYIHSLETLVVHVRKESIDGLHSNGSMRFVLRSFSLLPCLLALGCFQLSLYVILVYFRSSNLPCKPTNPTTQHGLLSNWSNLLRYYSFDVKNAEWNQHTKKKMPTTAIIFLLWLGRLLSSCYVLLHKYRVASAANLFFICSSSIFCW